VTAQREATDVAADIDAGRRTFAVQTRVLSRRVGVRAAVATAAVVLAAIAVGIVALTLGEAVLSVPEVIGALLGTGEPRAQLVVVEWRLPRVLAGLVFGAALGAAGAIFQSITRNPLGSPDIIGFDAGAYTGALIVMTTMSFGAVQLAFGALAGGAATAVLVYILAFRRGFQGFRLIIVGIGIASMLASVNTWIILNADLNLALMASAWGAGSLNAVTWEQVLSALVFLTPLAVGAVLLADRMHLLEMGDDAAAALGVRITSSRVLLVVIGVGFTAVVTSVAGPIGFVALAAPQIARRLTRSAGVTLTAAAAVGALVLTASDIVAQRLFAPTQLPVGLVTVCLGGVYLIWLLIQEARRR
jgi:iron complex transport system permease protein